MTLYAFRARDHRGVLVTGRMEGKEVRSIQQILDEQGLIPLAVQPLVNASASLLPSFKTFFQKKVSKEEILWMTRQFHTLFHAGLGMETILRTLAAQSANQRFKETLTMVASDISQGATLYQAFAKHSQVFDDLYLHMLSAGEEAGILDETLQNLSVLIEKEIEIKAQVKSATLYPKIVVGFLCAACVMTLTVVVPKFAQFYGHYGASLPLPTLLLMQASDILLHYSWIYLPLLGCGVVLFRRWRQTPKGKYRMDQLRFRIPVFGPLAVKIANARFAHLLAALHRSGIAMTRGLPLVAKVMDNAVMAHDTRQLQAEIEKGKTMAEAMSHSKWFAPVLVEAIRTGEKTGALDDLLEGLSRHLDQEIQHTTKNLTTMLEPFLLVVIFAMVAFFALAIFLPIWNLSRAVIH